MPTRSATLARDVWRNVLPAAAPGCSQGTPYSFWIREADRSKLAIILSGGGACWNGENCAVYGRPHYRPYAGLETDPTNRGGIFDLGHPENPLRDYTLVYLPTANGDLFLGDSVTTYSVPALGGRPAGEIRILHKGFDNAMSALEWAFETCSSPLTVAVMGWSAGAVASPLFTHIVARRFPEAVVTHFADGAGGYRAGDKLTELFTTWGTQNVLGKVAGFEDLIVEGLSFEDLYVRSAQLNPKVTFHQYNERNDGIQRMFLQLLGIGAPDVAANLDAAHACIRAKVSNFRTYTSWGSDEAIIGGYYDAILAKNALDNCGRPHVLDRLYTRKTDGVRFLDWFAAAISGQPVGDVSCRDCAAPEYHWERPISAI